MKEIVKKIRGLENKERIIFFLKGSTMGNFLIAFIKLFLALYIPSMWFFVNAIFNLVLGICRTITINCCKRIKKISNKKLRFEEEYKNYLQNGIMLILIGIAYFSVSIYMYYKGTNTVMHEYVTYLVALIAFYSIGTAIYGMIKYKRNKEPIIKGIKITKFASALTSIVLTQVVLLDTFAGGYDSTINGYTGMGVSIIIMILGFSMIISSKKDMNSYFEK